MRQLLPELSNLGGKLDICRACATYVLGRDRTAVHRQVLRVAAREQQSELRARQPRPSPHPVGVDVHERDSRGRVVADATALVDEGGVAQLLQRHVRKLHIHGLAEDVAALAGLPADGAAEHFIGAAGAIAADDMDRLGGAKLGMDLPDEVDEVGIDLDDLVLAPVAQSPVDLLHRLRDVLAVLHVLNGQRFLGVDAIEGDGSIACGVGRSARGTCHQRQCQDADYCGQSAKTCQARSLSHRQAAGIACPLCACRPLFKQRIRPEVPFAQSSERNSLKTPNESH